MIGIGPFDAFIVGVAAVALASPALLAAVTEGPPSAAIPTPVIAIAAAASVAFLGAALGAGMYGTGLAVVGLLLAAAELAGAAAIWLWRGTPSYGDDHRGWSDEDRPEGPSGSGVPAEYWRRWEQQLTGAR